MTYSDVRKLSLSYRAALIAAEVAEAEAKKRFEELTDVLAACPAGCEDLVQEDLERCRTVAPKYSAGEEIISAIDQAIFLLGTARYTPSRN